MVSRRCHEPSFLRFFGLATIVITCAMASNVSSQAQALPRECLYINSSGQGIPTVFSGRRPDPRFANQLGALTRQAASQQASTPQLRNLVYREGCPRRSVRSASLLQESCIGQYMEPEIGQCTRGCGGHSYTIYFSTGDFDCNGYVVGPDACNGCETQELHCDPCS